MGKPTSDDPLGQRPDLASFADMIERVVDQRIIMHVRGLTTREFDHTPDIKLVQELIARGWAVFRPQSNKGPEA